MRSFSRKVAPVLASLLALPVAAVVAAGPASAASDTTWNRLAACESSGRWAINTGNGYYGGVQFSLRSWRWVGGKGYPHQNSRVEQIRRAEILLDRQGWGAWPACSRKLGLTSRHAAGTPASLRAAAPARAARAKAPAARAASSAASTGRVHVVRSGDTLSSIARQYGVAGGWSAVWAANRSTVSNPNVISIGWRLRVPA